jgi:hypothetical protein
MIASVIGLVGTGVFALIGLALIWKTRFRLNLAGKLLTGVMLLAFFLALADVVVRLNGDELPYVFVLAKWTATPLAIVWYVVLTIRPQLIADPSTPQWAGRRPRP